MATAVHKEYFFPKEKTEKEKPTFIQQGGRTYTVENYGFGPTLVDTNADHQAGRYQETAGKLLNAQGAEADARAKNPEAALKAQSQAFEQTAATDLLGLKKKQGEAGITAILSQLGLDEKAGGGMDSVKGMSPELKKKLGIEGQQSFSSPSQEGETDIMKNLFPGFDATNEMTQFGMPASMMEKGQPVDNNSATYKELIDATKAPKVGIPKTGIEKRIYGILSNLGWIK